MKYITFLVALLLMTACTTPGNGSFVLSGTVENSRASKWIYLSYPIARNGIWYKNTDSTQIVNGKFRFEGKIPATTPAYIDFDNMYGIRIYLEPAKMKIRFDRRLPYEYTLSGSTAEKEHREFREKSMPQEVVSFEMNAGLQEIVEQLNANNVENRDSLVAVFFNNLQQFNANRRAKDSIRMDFVLEHMYYAIAPDLLYLLSKGQDYDIGVLKNTYDRLPEKNKKSILGQLAGIRIDFLASGACFDVGDTACDFVRSDPGGHIIRLADYRDKKYVLLDFWASWCGPCVRSLPTVKELYAKYGKSGLEVIGLSSDSDRNSWLEAIKKHKLTVYPQALSVESNGNNDELFFADQMDISTNYDIVHIPFYVLIDKQGKIIARWDHLGEEQLTYLGKLFQESK